MSVVCGTDFTEHAAEAATAAAAIAARWGQPLTLVHVCEPRPSPGCRKKLAPPSRHDSTPRRIAFGGSAPSSGASCWRERRTRPPARFREPHERDARRRRRIGTPIRRAVVHREHRGSRGAEQPCARARRPHGDLLPGVEPGRATPTGARRRRLLDDGGRSGRLGTGPRHLGGCDVRVGHVYWPAQEHARLGIRGPRSLVDAPPEVERVLTRELTARLWTAADAGVARPAQGAAGSGASTRGTYPCPTTRSIPAPPR